MDAPFFEKEGLATTFVGNAGLARDLGGVNPGRLRKVIGAGADDPILLVLPGSRPAEIERVMPVFEDAARRVKADRPDLRIVVPAASTVADLVRARVADWPFEAHLVEDEQSKFDAMAAATLALACSGSVTTELALAGCPMVVGYRIGPITYSILRFMVRTRYITLFNIAAQQAVAPEFIQGDCTGEKLAAALAERLDNADLRARQVAAQNAALLKMGRGGPDPAEKAAEVVVGMLGQGASFDARP
jgi:lipid-A-disaccharide synthase